MAFRPLLLWSLLGPAMLVLAPYLYALCVMWLDPGSTLQSRGVDVLFAAALLGCVTELVAVPSALFCLWRSPAYRTAGNVAATVAGGIPLAIGTLLYVSLMYGHR